MATTMSVKVSAEFAKRYRSFCEEHCLMIGRFTEQALLEAMEDFHFGKKAQAVLSRSTGETKTHKEAFQRRK